MHLNRLYFRDFRCFDCVDIQPEPGVNFITGGNATGKTSLLEAVFLLGRGQSFRPGRSRELVRDGAPDHFVIHGRFLQRRSIQHRIGITNKTGSLRYKVNDNLRAGRFDLINAAPIQLIEPNLHRLFEMGPSYRRSFLDWGVFHVEQQFFPAWRQYKRALRQRNKALRKRQRRDAISAWDDQLDMSARIINTCRKTYVERLKRHLPNQVSNVLGEQSLQIRYESGWNTKMSFSDTLTRSLDSDIQRGFTQHGPHRADLCVSVDGV